MAGTILNTLYYILTCLTLSNPSRWVLLLHEIISIYRCAERLSDLPIDQQHPAACICTMPHPLSGLRKAKLQQELFSVTGYLIDFPRTVEFSLSHFPGESIIRASPHHKVQIGQYQPCSLKGHISWKIPKAQTTIPLTHGLIREAVLGKALIPVETHELWEVHIECCYQFVGKVTLLSF